MKYVGAHVSSSGGVQNAPHNAARIGARAFALFTKNQRQWKAKPLTEAQIDGFKKGLLEVDISPEQVLPHDSYLINLGTPDPTMRQKSYDAFVDELDRCHKLGLTLLNFHPGSHVKKCSEEESLELIADAVNRALAEVSGVVAVLENTAGQGTNMGHQLAHLGAIINKIEDKSRIGVCIDTCHAFAAGYDLRSDEGYRAMWHEFDEQIGAAYLRGMHLNDSKKPFASRRDRHDKLGEGEIGWEPFRRLMNDPRTDGIPLILETPNSDGWAAEIRALYALVD